mgnify:CR=1 FL=1
MNSNSFLQKCDWLSKLQDSSKLRIIQNGVVLKFKANQKIYDKNSCIDALWVVITGVVRLGIDSDRGGEIIKHLVYSEEVFGESDINTDSKRNEFAKAHTSCTCLRIPQPVFLDLIKGDPLFREKIILTTVDRIKQLNDRITAINNRTVSERVIHYIYQQIKNRGTKIGISECLVTNGVSYKDIALITNTSRLAVAKIMKELRNLNIIYFNPIRSERILIRDLNALEALYFNT